MASEATSEIQESAQTSVQTGDLALGQELMLKRKKKASHVRVEMVDERNAKPQTEIFLERPIILSATHEGSVISTKDISEPLRAEYSYLSATRELEINTERTKIIQEIVDKMVAGNEQWEGNLRVVIMNKGKEPEAFAFPDGTIFISQSLISILDSLDEIGAVMAHEVRHVTNGTALTAYQTEIVTGGTIGARWLHEMTSDTGTPEFLEKAGLKSTALTDVMVKLADYFGNIRGSEHQAPLLRAIQVLGVHAAKDYETSHINYTPIPDVLFGKVSPTNLEEIIDAVVRDDVAGVEEYLPKLHLRDLYGFYRIADDGGYYGLSTEYPSGDTDKKVARVVRTFVEGKLREMGMTEAKIKVFLLATTRGYMGLQPKFENLAEINSLISTAGEMYRSEEIATASETVFGRKRKDDPLIQLVDYVRFRKHWFTDTTELEYIDYYSMGEFIGAVYKEIAEGLGEIRDNRFIEPNGDLVSRDKNRYVAIYEDLHGILFDYIAEYYIPNVEGGELDRSQIEDIFRSARDSGYMPRVSNYFFPIDNLDEKHREVIEDAYREIFGIDLVIHAGEREIVPLPTLDNFRVEIQKMSPWDVAQYVNQLVIDHRLTSEQVDEYTRAGYEHFETADFVTRRKLESLIENEIGISTMMDWRAHGDPRWDIESSEGKRWLTLDDLIQEYNLDREALYKEARRLGEIDRMRIQIDFLVEIRALSEGSLFAFVEDLMEKKREVVGTLDQYKLLEIGGGLFGLANKVDKSDTRRISDYERFYRLPLVQEIVKQTESVRCENLDDLAKRILEMKVKYTRAILGSKFTLFEDDLHSVLLAGALRRELYRLTEPGQVRRQDYPVIISLLNNEFISSPQQRDIIRALQRDYITDPTIGIQEKIDYFAKEYKALGIEGAVRIAEQITDIATYRKFRQVLDGLGEDYISGEKSMNKAAIADIVSSELVSKADLLIKTASSSETTAREVSTDMAFHWIETYMNGDSSQAAGIKYDPVTKRFVLSELGKATFVSFADMISYLKGLPDTQKLIMSLKALSDQDGLLTTEKGRSLLERMLVDGLEMKQPFIRETLKSAIRDGDTKIVGLPAAQMLVPFLFRALKPSSIDVSKLRRTSMITGYNNDGSNQARIGSTVFSDDLPRILRESTTSLRYFGFRYANQPNSEIGQMAQESGEKYYAILENLAAQIVAPDVSGAEKIKSDVSPATEALISAGETSPIFVRGMQMAVQLIDFDESVRERLALTQDSMRGMEKLRFWDNLLTKAQTDPELGEFLEKKLISLDDYLGGGSLFTTYGATIRDADGKPKSVVIKMLNPNAEEFIRLSYDFSTAVLGEVERKTRGKTRREARLAGSLLELSNTWCIRDINDDTYAARDDAFRMVVDSFNKKEGSGVIEAPERIYTSKKVKIEEQCDGITLNKYLSRKDIPRESKERIIKHLIDFYDHQFDYSPVSLSNGTKIHIFHSDPHVGNYMLQPNAGETMSLSVIDRSMYLALGENDVQMFRTLKEGDGVKFIDKFIGRCLEINGVTSHEATNMRLKIFNKLGGEFLRQKVSNQEDTAAYLQIVMQEFADYGERYTAANTDVVTGGVEATVAKFVEENPGVGSLKAYKTLGKQLKEITEEKLSYQQFKNILAEMQKRGVLTKKSIAVPLEYRLMIRNIVAMQNLKNKWVGKETR